jgi:hypothetical protein
MFGATQEVIHMKVLLGIIAILLALPVLIVIAIAAGPAALVLLFIAGFGAVVAVFMRPRAPR